MHSSDFFRKMLLTFIAISLIQATFTSFARSAETANQEHKVGFGENLWKLSEKYLLHGVSFPHLAKKNSNVVTHPDLIFPGDVLNIPKCETNFECRDRKNFAAQAGDMQKARSSFGTLIVENGWKTRWKALDVTRKALDHGNATGGWDVSAGINRKAIATLLSTVVGSKLVNRGNGFLSGTEVTVDDIALVPSLASLDALVKITAQKGPLTLNLLMEGAVLVSRIEYASDKKGKEIARIHFLLEPIRVQPIAKLGRLSVSANRFWSRLAPDLARTLLEPEVFETSVDLPAEFTIETGIDSKREEKKTGKDAVLTYSVSAPKTKLRSPIAYTAPIYSGNAIWLMGKLRKEDAKDIEPDSPPKVSQVELRLAVQEQYERLQENLPAELIAFGVDDEEPKIAARLQNRLIADLTGQLATLTPEQREVSFKLISYQGDLSREDWSIDGVARGGARTYIECATCAWATVKMGKPSFQQEIGRVGFNLPVSAVGKLALGIHIDPLIGGGAGTSVGFDVNTGATKVAKVNAEPLIIKDAEGRPSAVLKWNATCENLDLVALSDGKLKFREGWISAPKVGVRIKAPIGPEVLEPILLYDAKPNLLLFPKPQPSGNSRWSRDWWVVTRNVGATTTLFPRVFSVRPDSIFASADLQIQVTPRPMDDFSGDQSQMIANQLIERTNSQRDQIDAVTKDAIKAHARQTGCDTNLEIAVRIGDFEFGPNNEFVKFFRNAWNDVTKGPGPNNEVVKFLNAVGIDRKAQAQFASELKKVQQKLEDARKDLINSVEQNLKGAKRTIDRAADSTKRNGRGCLGHC
ncbi:LysM peptidoglycan-binding domain-containing protein [Roseibium marinum]|uniref:LysM domain-containing protein n=1 Tax=Roseibium marinum TaxID=281252 RepID=A0A2S3USG7_9HYPH|nr:LysM peptidoglycan-binding domain-containing protein [Roseibium marinum]POF30510.1 LysM domain-containing protein [Roseibium marinum]